MKVRDIMTRAPAFCEMETNLCAATELLWERNCGILPVVNEERRVVAVVTDRDICIAVGTRNRLPSEMTVGEVASGNVFACKPDDSVQTALTTMAQGKVRRLPVIDAEGKLEGLLSMDDVIQQSASGKEARPDSISYHEVIASLRSIYQPVSAERGSRKIAAA